MAQQNTGLGWSAESDWLTEIAEQTIGRISYIGGPDFPNQPMNGVYAISDVTTANGTASRVISGTLTQYMCNYIAPDLGYPEADILLCYVKSGSYYRRLFITNVSGAVCAQRVWNSSSQSYDFDGTTSVGTNYSSTYGLYYRQENDNRSIGEIPPNIPIFDTQAQAFSAVQRVNTPFTKDNAGFAVACVAKWLTQNGTELNSPILISSDTSFVNMTTTATGYNIAKLNYLLSGTRFYMAFWDIPGSVPVTTDLEYVDLTERGNMSLDQLFMTLISTSYAHIIIISSPDPYEQQTGSSEEEGGDGEEIVDDDVDFTPMPSSMAVASGFITLFCPSQYELNQLANYMWSPLFDVDTFKKLFANPMDCILGLAVYPFPISASGTKTVSVGGIATTVSMGYTLQQYHIVDCGSVYVPKQWGAYMDFAPYTRFNIFLPYIGFRPVSADDIMGKTISLRYMVDILSGACNAELKCGSTVLYSWAGSCAAQIPITGNDWRSAITAGISIAGSVAATVLTQGASAPMIAGTIASATVNSTQLKPEVQRSGSISGSSGFLAGQRPYLVRTNPRSAIPANQNKYSGYPSFVTILLGSLSGYNEVYSVHLENIPATGAELDEIESILKGGAIF